MNKAIEISLSRTFAGTLLRMPVKLLLRSQEYEVKSGMSLRDSLLKIDLIPESVLGTIDGELVTDDVILRDGQVVKLIAVISGGSDMDAIPVFNKT